MFLPSVTMFSSVKLREDLALLLFQRNWMFLGQRVIALQESLPRLHQINMHDNCLIHDTLVSLIPRNMLTCSVDRENIDYFSKI